MRVLSLYFCTLVLASTHTAVAQDSLPGIEKVLNFPTRSLDNVNKKATLLEEKLVSYSERALVNLEKQEQKLKKKLARKDSLAAVQIFGDVQSKYKELRQQLNNQGNKLTRYKEYLPGFDTLKTSLNFLSQNAHSLLANNQQIGKLNEAIESINGLDEKLQGASAIRSFLKDRRQQLRDQLGKFGLTKEFQKYNKQAYYYSQQIKEYQAILQDHQKREQKAMELITKLPAFQKFFQEHSELAGLFPAPANYGTIQGLQGLQTRSEVQDLLQSHMAAGGPNAGQMVQQSMKQAQAQLSKLKDKINKAGGNSSDFDIPEFNRPNTEKTKSFWKRLTYGTDFQHNRSSTFIPSSSDIGLSVGYRIDEKTVIGIGGSYKISWKGKINNLTVANEGIGIRSFIDWKLKGSIYLSGGYEQNYRQQFITIQQLKQAEIWQSSGLIGVSKFFTLKNKVIKKTKVQLLWDFMSYQQVPQTQPLVFRIGYELK